MCKYWNGGCSKDAKCSQKGEKVSCTCLKGFSGDGFECTPVDPCADGENGGCHEHAICTMTGAVSRNLSFKIALLTECGLYTDTLILIHQ